MNQRLLPRELEGHDPTLALLPPDKLVEKTEHQMVFYSHHDWRLLQQARHPNRADNLRAFLFQIKVGRAKGTIRIRSLDRPVPGQLTFGLLG